MYKSFNYLFVFSFFFNDTTSSEIYTLSLHDALPISPPLSPWAGLPQRHAGATLWKTDRKSTRLNSSHSQISYAVFCLKKKTLTKPFLFYKTTSHVLLDTEHSIITYVR